MRLILILASIVSAHAGVIKNDTCDGIKISNQYHDVELLLSDIDRPYLLTVDYSTNLLYFSYSVQGDVDSSKTARLNLNTKELHDIRGVNNGFAQTVDQKTHDIYIGGSDGLYKYNYETDKITFLGEKDVDIWNVYFSDVLYYSIYPTQFLYTFKDGQSTRFKDLEDTKVDNFLIDSNNITFFTNSSGLYSQHRGMKNATLYRGFPDNGVRGLSMDRNGKVYACLRDGIYLVNKETATAEKVVDIDDAFGIAFDVDNNFIYSDARNLVRLKPNKNKSC